MLNTKEEIKEDAWFWYVHLCAMEKEGIPPRRYCKKHNLPRKIMANKIVRIWGVSRTNPKKYQERMNFHAEYVNSQMKPGEFAEHQGVTNSFVSSLIYHVNTVNRIEAIRVSKGYTRNMRDDFDIEAEMAIIKNQMPRVNPHKSPTKIKQPNDPTPMAFIPVQNEKKHLEPVKNDLEIIITKGVRILISQDIDKMKLIKIIELLQGI